MYFNPWVPLSLAGTTMNTIALPFVVLFLYYACPNDGTFCLSGIDVASLVNMPIPYAPSNFPILFHARMHTAYTQEEDAASRIDQSVLYYRHPSNSMCFHMKMYINVHICSRG